MQRYLNVWKIGFCPKIESDSWTYSSPDSILPSVRPLAGTCESPASCPSQWSPNRGETSIKQDTWENYLWKILIFFSFMSGICIWRYLTNRLGQTDILHGQNVTPITGEIMISVPKNNKYPILYKKILLKILHNIYKICTQLLIKQI